MKTLTYNLRSVLFTALFFVCSVMNARAQFTSSVTSQQHDLSFSAGRDFWLAEMSNNWGVNEGGAYMRLYITSRKNTIAHIEYEGIDILDTVHANAASTVLLQPFIQMQSSGYVESKAVHIWSDDAPLIVYNLNHMDDNSNGEYVIPTIGWGNDYVVAAYGSLYEDGQYVYDYPSELALVASTDNDTVVIIPSCNCRRAKSGNASPTDSNATFVTYPAGQTVSFVLNRGQSLELLATKATNTDNFDLTGTIIHASHPVGVFGGSMLTNIPADFLNANHIEDMISPVRTWGTTYIGTSFHEPPEEVGHDYGLYLLIGSVPGQTIDRHDCTTGESVAAVIPNSYGYVWDEEELGQEYYSNAPFLCVEYINSATYPDGNNGSGNPSEAQINPIEQFSKTVEFETPTSGNPYYNYANVTVNVKDAKQVLFDGQPISTIPPQCVDSNWSIYTVSNMSGGSHLVTGDDSGVGVYIYGNGYGNSYAWSSESFEGTYNSPDSGAPLAQINAGCTNATVTFADTGANASLLSAIWLDSSFNATFNLDTAWREGIPTVSDSFTSSILDLSKPALMKVSVYDVAGNSTTVTLSYTPLPLTISQPSLNFGTFISGGTGTALYDTLLNTSNDTLDLTSITLVHGNKGFRIDSAVMGLILAGTKQVVKLSFDTIPIGNVFDTVVLSNGCLSAAIVLHGAGIANDWSVDSAVWRSVPFPSLPVSEVITVHNHTSLPIHITSASADSSEFSISSLQFPLDISANGLARFAIDYTPAYSDQQFISLLHVHSANAGEHDAELTVTSTAGIAAQPADLTVVQPQSNGTIRIVAPGATRTEFELQNILGETVYSRSISGTELLNVSALPVGTYFWRLTAGSHIQSGKIILGE